MWTEDKILILKKNQALGKTAREIAEILGPGFTRNSVIGKLFRLGVKLNTKKKSTKTSNNSHEENREKFLSFRGRKFKSILIPKDFPPAKFLNLEELTEETCKYMIHKNPKKEGHPNVLDSFFCSRKTVEKFSYCLLHMSLVWQIKDKKPSKEVLLDKDDEVPKFISKKIKSA